MKNYPTVTEDDILTEDAWQTMCAELAAAIRPGDRVNLDPMTVRLYHKRLSHNGLNRMRKACSRLSATYEGKTRFPRTEDFVKALMETQPAKDVRWKCPENEKATPEEIAEVEIFRKLSEKAIRRGLITADKIKEHFDEPGLMSVQMACGSKPNALLDFYKRSNETFRQVLARKEVGK